MKDKYSSIIRKAVRDTYDAIASEFDRTRQYKWREFDEFVDKVKKGSRVLDLGCGNGRLYKSLESKKIDYIGVDQSSGMIEAARKNHPGVQFELSDMVDLGFHDHSFDAVFSIASFHHLPGKYLRKRGVKEMHRVLKKDGLLVLTVWNLFQWKYWFAIVESVLSFLIHFGMKHSWNDLWIGWGKAGQKRYYHAFLPRELGMLFGQKDWEIEELYFSRKGTRVRFLRSFNLCLIARKK